MWFSLRRNLTILIKTNREVFIKNNPKWTFFKRRFCDNIVNNELPNCNIGTIGHVDHGKTTLTAAITKLQSKKGFAKFVPYEEIDRSVEERTRGITIHASHIGYRTETRNYAHTDCPGHADFVRNMISGASQMDGAILVVSADDGPMPQTREHLLLTKQVGVKKLVLFINKADLVDKDVLELVQIEMIEMLESFGYDPETPTICGSALLALNGDTSEYGEPSIQKLLDTIDAHIPIPTRDLNAPFLMPIDGVFTAPGRGTVCIGTIKRGTMEKNAKASLMGFDQNVNTTLSVLQIFKKNVSKAYAGDNVGVLLRGLKMKSIDRGMILCAQGSEKLTNSFTAEFYLLSKSEGGRSKPINNSGYIQQLFSTTWDIACRIDLVKGNKMLMPGEHTTVQLTLLRGMVLSIGQPFTIRENNVTVGTGCITGILPPICLVKTGGLNKVNIANG